MNTRALFTPATNAMTLMRNEVERMFDNAFCCNSVESRGYPSLNMIDDDTNIYVEAEIPGVQMENINVTVADGMLSINGTRSAVTPEGASTLRRERGSLEFERSISLPTNVDPAGTRAVLRNGILTLTLPRSANCRARQVPVTAD
jgi:HSP20 family protein